MQLLRSFLECYNFLHLVTLYLINSEHYDTNQEIGASKPCQGRKMNPRERCYKMLEDKVARERASYAEAKKSKINH